MKQTTAKVRKGELVRVGGNGTIFVIRKDDYINLKPADILDNDGNIKQSALKLFLFANALSKTREKVREYLVNALHAGKKAKGELQASITIGEPVKVLDKDMLETVLSRYGYTVEQFYKAGKNRETLIVE
jgi:hypothetical protein